MNWVERDQCVNIAQCEAGQSSEKVDLVKHGLILSSFEPLSFFIKAIAIMTLP